MKQNKYNYVKVIQQNYGHGWEDNSEYQTNSKLSNGDNGITTDNWSDKVEPMKQEVIKLFNGNLKGFYINSDPRGCSLKINDTQFKEYYNQTGLTRDWGGNGLLSPDIS